MTSVIPFRPPAPIVLVIRKDVVPGIDVAQPDIPEYTVWAAYTGGRMVRELSCCDASYGYQAAWEFAEDLQKRFVGVPIIDRGRS